MWKSLAKITIHPIPDDGKHEISRSFCLHQAFCLSVVYTAAMDACFPKGCNEYEITPSVKFSYLQKIYLVKLYLLGFINVF